jgi:cytoskeletal protein CcmA (bactofilin family)
MIGPGITIRGNVTGDEDLTVEGRIEGAVRLSRDLTVQPGAELAAEVEARTVTVGGAIRGTVAATEGLTIEAGAVVVGDITTPRLIIEDGARFKGRVTMQVDIPGLEARPAPGGGQPARRR